MSQGDLLADRKRLKQSLAHWRILAILAAIGLVLVLTRPLDAILGVQSGGSYIAQITVDGIMTDDPEREKLLKKIRNDSHAKALIVRLDSPGGTTVGGEELYLQLRNVAEKKPVVGVMRTVCASACYMASLGADHVLAREGTLTGSIGVLLQSAEFSRMADKLGITPITIKSGKYKDAPSFTEPFTADERAVVRAVVLDAYDQFVELIVKRRKLDKAQVLKLADGRVFTGRQALPLKLIDGTGGIAEARIWLAQKRKIHKNLEIRVMDEKPRFDSLIAHLSQWTGIEIFNRLTVGLDGLVSIWHPSAVQ